MPRASRLLVETYRDVTSVTFTDATVIDLQHIDNIRDELLELLVKQDRRKVILHMGKVQHFSSSALGMLVEAAAASKKQKGTLVLCGVQPEIRKIFKITKLEKQFRFAADEKAALAALGAR
ncbi:MAG TPA: STAS domain-containing protein [Phycisphaerae bacterium]|nr:STAS domain-containing protein [Phycisphaerales bacterium]HRX85328.1 STAS domain-containing protein [Phycisphaerae bacterium]